MARTKQTPSNQDREKALRKTIAAKSKKGLKAKEENVPLERKAPRFSRFTVAHRNFKRVEREAKHSKTKLIIGQTQFKRIVKGVLELIPDSARVGGFSPEALDYIQHAVELNIAKIFSNAFEQRVDSYTPAKLQNIREKRKTITLKTDNFTTAARQFGNMMNDNISSCRRQVRAHLRVVEQALRELRARPRDAEAKRKAHYEARPEPPCRVI